MDEHSKGLAIIGRIVSNDQVIAEQQDMIAATSNSLSNGKG